MTGGNGGHGGNAGLLGAGMVQRLAATPGLVRPPAHPAPAAQRRVAGLRPTRE